MKYQYEILMPREEVVTFHRLAYMTTRLEFINKKAKGNQSVSSQQKLLWTNMLINYRLGLYEYRDAIFMKYQLPVDYITAFEFDLDNSRLLFSLREGWNDD